MIRRKDSNLRTKFVDQTAARLYTISKERKTENVPYAGVVFDVDDVKESVGALYDAFVSGWFSLGRRGNEFENEFCKFLGVKYCILTNSGSSANLLAVAAMLALKRLKPGDEVLTPAVTFPTTVNPLLFYGLKPVLVDVELPSYTVSARSLRESASSAIKGLMLPHLNGSASHMPEIVSLAKESGWTLIEDCCDALGTKIGESYVGTFGHASTFSFYGAHHMSMGEGGAVCTNDADVARTVRSLRDWGRAVRKEASDVKKVRTLARVGKGSTLPADYEMRYTYVTRGFNLKPLDIQAAMGLAQLRKVKRFGKVRRRNYRFLKRGLSRFGDYLILPEPAEGVDPSWFVFPLVLKDNVRFSRSELTDHLEKAGIETRPLLAGNITKQPAYKDVEFVTRSALPNSDLVLRNGFFVGVFPGLSLSQLSKVVASFKSFFSAKGLA